MDSYRTSLPPELDANRRHAAKRDTAEPAIQADEILTVEETAAMLKVKKRALYNLIFEGKLRAKRINKWNFRILKKRSAPLYETLKETPLELPRPPLFLQESLDLQVLIKIRRPSTFEPIVH